MAAPAPASRVAFVHGSRPHDTEDIKGVISIRLVEQPVPIRGEHGHLLTVWIVGDLTQIAAIGPDGPDFVVAISIGHVDKALLSWQPGGSHAIARPVGELLDHFPSVKAD